MLSRHVAARMKAANDPALPFRRSPVISRKPTWPSSISNRHFSDKGGPPTAGMVFKAPPEGVEGLKFAGIDVVSTANNHARDQRSTDCSTPSIGLRRTRSPQPAPVAMKKPPPAAARSWRQGRQVRVPRLHLRSEEREP